MILNTARAPNLQSSNHQCGMKSHLKKSRLPKRSSSCSPRVSSDLRFCKQFKDDKHLTRDLIWDEHPYSYDAWTLDPEKWAMYHVVSYLILNFSFVKSVSLPCLACPCRIHPVSWHHSHMGSSMEMKNLLTLFRALEGHRQVCNLLGFALQTATNWYATCKEDDDLLVDWVDTISSLAALKRSIFIGYSTEAIKLWTHKTKVEDEALFSLLLCLHEDISDMSFIIDEEYWNWRK